MSNKKLSRLMEPNLKLYFFFLAVFAIITVSLHPLLGVAEVLVAGLLYVYFTRNSQKRRQSVIQYIDNVTGSVDTASLPSSTPPCPSWCSDLIPAR